MSNEIKSNQSSQENNPEPMPERPTIPEFPKDRIEKGEKPDNFETK